MERLSLCARRSETDTAERGEREKGYLRKDGNAWNSGSRSLGKILGAICIRFERGQMRQKKKRRGKGLRKRIVRGEMSGDDLEPVCFRRLLST